MFQHPNHRGAKGEEKEQEIENLFEQIMKENFLNLEKEIDFQEVQDCLLYTSDAADEHRDV